jgi:hypothetical protein
MSRLYRVLLDGGDEDNLIQVAMLSGAISSAVMRPLVGDIDDDTLRAKLTAWINARSTRASGFARPCSVRSTCRPRCAMPTNSPGP